MKNHINVNTVQRDSQQSEIATIMKDDTLTRNRTSVIHVAFVIIENINLLNIANQNIIYCYSQALILIDRAIKDYKSTLFYTTTQWICIPKKSPVKWTIRYLTGKARHLRKRLMN